MSRLFSREFAATGKFQPVKAGRLKGGDGLAERKKPGGGVRSGLERIAFGGVNDAVSLLFQTEPDPEELRRLDLYSVAEIRRMKDGGIEIKFYDRMKALECLRQMEESGAGRSPLYRALEECARAQREEKDGV